MSNKPKAFLVSTADFALFYNDMLACTGTTNLNTSIEVTMQEQNVNAGKGNKLVYSFKYGRELNVTLEAANWDLRYLAANSGSEIQTALSDAYKIAECITINKGIGVLPAVPIGDVAVELSEDTVVTVPAKDNTIDLTAYGITSGTVSVTYKYSSMAKTVVIDTDSSPKVYKLVLDADKHNNKLGKVGSVQIEIPSYQPSGGFSISFTPDGATSTNIDGKALAVEGDTCESGGAVYAYIREFDDTVSAVTVSEIAATPAAISLDSGDTAQTARISVVGLKGAMFSSVELPNTDCEFTVDDEQVATVDNNGVVTAVAAGSTKITVTYNGVSDEISVVVA